MFKITKAHEGRTVFCVPTGNNVRRNGTSAIEQVEELKVSNIKRKYLDLGDYSKVYLCSDDTEDYLRYETGLNSGYIVFETKVDFEEYLEYVKDKELIHERLRSYNLGVNKDQIKAIAAILKEG